MMRTSLLLERGRTAAHAGTVDTTAPVIASASIDIAAGPDAVWDVLTDVEAWPRFVPGVARSRLLNPEARGRLAPSSRFAWVNNGVPIRSRIEVMTAEHRLTWTGSALWLVAVHRNTLEPLDAGGCRLTSDESMAGLGARWLMPKQRLETGLEHFVGAIAQEARRRCE